METVGGKSAFTSIRYYVDKDEVEDMCDASTDDPPTPRSSSNEAVSSKGNSILEKYFRSVKLDTEKDIEIKDGELNHSAPKKDVTSSPMKDYLNRLKRNANLDSSDGDKKDAEPWKLFNEFRNKISQTVEDIKARNTDEKKSRDNSISESEESLKEKEADKTWDSTNQAPSQSNSFQNLVELNDDSASVLASGSDDSAHTSQDSTPTHTGLKKDAEIESGVEAIEALSEENDFVEVGPTLRNSEDKEPQTVVKTFNYSNKTPYFKPVPLPCRNEGRGEEIPEKPKVTLQMKLLSVFLFFTFIFFPINHIFFGMVFGAWALVMLENVIHNFLYNMGFNMDRINCDKGTMFRGEGGFTMPTIKEHKPLSKNEGWVNQYECIDYHPLEYNLNKTVSAFMKLEGSTLRLSYTQAKVPKKALYDEKIENVAFTKHCIYKLDGAKILLEPNGIVRKRLWSKKYPICIVLKDNDTTQIMESSPADEKMNLEHIIGLPEKSSPEKSISKLMPRKNSKGDLDIGSLRQRFKRKIQKDKTELGNDDVFPKELETVPPNSLGIEEPLTPTATTLPSQSLDESDTSKSDVIEENQQSLTITSSQSSKLYIFARTGRDKFEWYRLLQEATNESCPSTPEDEYTGSVQTVRGESSVSFTTGTPVPEPSWDHPQDGEIDWRSYSQEFAPYFHRFSQHYKSDSTNSDPAFMWWFNNFICRYAYDALRSQALHDSIKTKIEKKLATLKIPSFIGGLRITSLSFGDACPAIKGIKSVERDSRGTWIKLDVSYKGNAKITLATSIKIKKLADDTTIEVQTDETFINNVLVNLDQDLRMRSAVFNSDMEDSGESSADEGSTDANTASGSESGGSSTKKIIKMVDKITANKYFQQFSDNKYVKKAVENFLSTEISVQLELKELSGTLCINFPDPPHDRIWLAFDENPNVNLKATAVLGSKTLRFAQLTGWIEQKLLVELHRAVVMPNMEDFILDGLAPTPVIFE